MKKQTLEPRGTKQRLLDAASRIFAEKGFHGASVCNICERAGANIATANYHFHGKEKLYQAVIQSACQQIHAQRSLRAERTVGQTPEQKLCAGIRSLFQNLAQESDSGWLVRLLVRGLAEQGGGLDRLVAAALWTHAARLEEPLRELLGPHASRDCVHLCALSVVSQCVFFCGAQSSLQRLCPELGKDCTGSEELIAHVARFAAAALAHLKEGSAKPNSTKTQTTNKA